MTHCLISITSKAIYRDSGLAIRVIKVLSHVREICKHDYVPGDGAMDMAHADERTRVLRYHSALLVAMANDLALYCKNYMQISERPDRPQLQADQLLHITVIAQGFDACARRG
jgi:hypothetical protein